MTNKQKVILDRDVRGYYPAIILGQNLYPESVGKLFISVFKQIVDKRNAAKKSGDKTAAESLKIVNNSTYGKMGNKWSFLFSPNLIVQTTITGQLALLMLIEQLESARISVVSANTDGVLIYCDEDRINEVENIVGAWELITGFETEETSFRKYCIRDVNNFISIKSKGGVKLKGAYAPAGLMKNPTNEICSEAVVAYLDKGINIRTTIENCKDIRKFVSVRQVKGGAVKDDEYLGRVVRWYYSYLAFGTINYAVNGYIVPRSEGAMPCMTLPDEFPSDLDYNWYIAESEKILKEIGV